MATTAADAAARRARLHRWSVVAVSAAASMAVLVASCSSGAKPPRPTPAPAPGPPRPAQPAPPPAVEPTPLPAAPPEAEQPAEPQIRVGLAVGVSSATIAGFGGLSLSDSAGARLAELPAGELWRVEVQGPGIVARAPGGASTAPTDVMEIVSPMANAPVLVNGRPYRGSVFARRDGSGVTLVDRLPMEAYLEGVVSAEMGRRSSAEQEALRAQAVVSRTFALRNLRRWQAQGFDLYAGVADQVYGGAAAETPEGRAAVEATRGRILTYGGAPIDAFFYSPCGGRTAEGTEVFRGADRPYLRSVP
ncbi:MAG TPA: SpoIID/LytB domain-containing protein, partial [Gemmatimonadales bacterium]|nr:SpoIID/LytB domain-containing protein [Gemmatimonadales bacterium]